MSKCILCALIASTLPALAQNEEPLYKDVIQKDGPFYSRFDTVNKNHYMGQWLEPIADNLRVWDATAFGYSTADPGWLSAMNTAIPGSIMTGNQGFPGVNMAVVLATPESKAQFLKDMVENGISTLGIGPGQSATATTMRGLLSSNPSFTANALRANIQAVANGKLVSPAIQSAILLGGITTPIDLTGTGFTQQNYIDGTEDIVGFNNQLYLSNFIFDEV